MGIKGFLDFLQPQMVIGCMGPELIMIWTKGMPRYSEVTFNSRLVGKTDHFTLSFNRFRVVRDCSG